MDIVAYKIIVYATVEFTLGIIGLLLRRTHMPAYKPIRIRAVKNHAGLIESTKSKLIL